LPKELSSKRQHAKIYTYFKAGSPEFDVQSQAEKLVMQKELRSFDG